MLGHVAEGVYTVREVHRLAQRLDVAMPICEAVYRILYEHIPVAEMIEELLNRTPNLEFNRGGNVTPRVFTKKRLCESTS